MENYQLEKAEQPQTKTLNGLSTVEKQINEANTGKFVQDSTRTELLQVLAYCFSVTGLTTENIPQEANKAVLLDFILSTYGSYRLEEIRAAFRLAVADKLPTADGKPIEHFQNFSAQYFGRVMSAFTKKSQDLKSYQQMARSWNQPVTHLHRSDEIPDEEMVRLSFENYRKVGKWQLIYPGCYKIMKRYGYEIPFEEGGGLRHKFNQLRSAEKRGSFPEDNEIRFKKYLTAHIFSKLIAQGVKDLVL